MEEKVNRKTHLASCIVLSFFFLINNLNHYSYVCICIYISFGNSQYFHFKYFRFPSCVVLIYFSFALLLYISIIKNILTRILFRVSF